MMIEWLILFILIVQIQQWLYKPSLLMVSLYHGSQSHCHNCMLDSNTKSTDAQGILKPKSVILREEGGLGFLMIKND